MTTKRIAIVCFEGPHNIIGGVQRRIAAEVAELSKRDIELTVIYSGKGAPFVEGRVRYILVPVPALIYPLQTILFSAQVARLLNKLPPFDLVETHHDAGLCGLLSAVFYGRKPARAWLEVIHGIFLDEFFSIFRYGRIFSFATLRASALAPLAIFELFAAHSATLVLTVSDYSADKIHHLYRVPKSRIRVFPNGIDTAFFRPKPQGREADPETSRPAKRKLVFVGRLDPRKGALTLVHAFAQLLKQYPQVDLEIIGKGLQEEKIREECKRLKISDAIHLRGTLTDAEIADAYRSAYISCMPSLQEGQGISALEAQACGTPVIASGVGGLPEVIQDRQTGILVHPPGDAAALFQALLEICTDEDLRNRLAHNSVEWAASFDWETLFQKNICIYEDLLSGQ